MQVLSQLNTTSETSWYITFRLSPHLHIPSAHIRLHFCLLNRAILLSPFFVVSARHVRSCCIFRPSSLITVSIDIRISHSHFVSSSTPINLSSSLALMQSCPLIYSFSLLCLASGLQAMLRQTLFPKFATFFRNFPSPYPLLLEDLCLAFIGVEQ